MNKSLRLVSSFCIILVLALLARLTWVQGYQAQALDDNSANRRVAITQYDQQLGNIMVDGQPITGSAEESSGDMQYKRTYTDGALYAPVTGYNSQVYGATQLEGIYQDVLDGEDPMLATVGSTLNGNQAKPGDVYTTIDPDVQQAAYKALGDDVGAAVAIDPQTGAIKAMASTPSYDPSKISGDTSSDQEAWNKLQDDDDPPMLNRALRQTYPPGSTFKLVVTAAALEGGYVDSITAPTNYPDTYTLPGTTTVLTNENQADPCSGASLEVALEYSCNTVFAPLAVEIGQKNLKEMADKFGFDDDSLDVPTRAAKSTYPTGMSPDEVAQTGIGQFDVTATPLEMAMVSAAVANGGTLMQPYMVDKITDSGGETAEQTSPTTYSEPVSSSVAEQMQQAMIATVTDGTASTMAIDGLTVGGKTGTAQNGVDNSNKPYAWITGYAEDSSGNDVAVAVVVADSNASRDEVSGGGQAGPVAKAMMEAALGNS
ncbi:peptidoglycan D,D-transpeptidase FtsI family protein [Streptomyces fractus]|uniref:peptidoglycan D,D-transpeptidase FtsI family protein n=1 Tax=Streptomyces fractus TaxID=641806 RepID=UPI003CECF01B